MQPRTTINGQEKDNHTRVFELAAVAHAGEHNCSTSPGKRTPSTVLGGGIMPAARNQESGLRSSRQGLSCQTHAKTA